MRTSTSKASKSLPPGTDQGRGHALNDVNDAINTRSHYEDLPVRVLRFVGTFPLKGVLPQSDPMDTAYARSVDEVRHLKTGVLELKREIGDLSQKARSFNLEMNKMRLHFEQRLREVSENLQSKTQELEGQRAETQIWRHRAERLDTLARQSGPKRSSAETVFENMGLFPPEANPISQPPFPFTGPVVAGATEANTDVQFTTDARSFSVSPEVITQAPAAPIQARAVADSTGASAATSIDLTIDESPGTISISPNYPVSVSSSPSSKAQGIAARRRLEQRIKGGAEWMGEAHPWKRVKRPAVYGPALKHAAKRIRLDTAVSAQSTFTTTAKAAEAAKTTEESKRAKKRVHCANAKAKAKAKAVQQKEEQQQRESERVRELQRDAKLRDDHRGGQAIAAKGKAGRGGRSALEKERARKREEAPEASSKDPFADLFDASDDDDLFRADEGLVDAEGEEEDDGLGAELEAAMAEEAREDDGLETELEAAMAEEEARR